MPRFCVTRKAQPTSGDHEVHDLGSTKECLPDIDNRMDLGHHATCRTAVSAAKELFSDVNGCYYCANECHTT
jgi:hypothetical protein